MLKIRLKRYGRKKKAVYRIIIIDSRKKRDGKAIEEVGFYDPANKRIDIKLASIIKRIKEGAQMSQTVKYLVKNQI